MCNSGVIDSSYLQRDKGKDRILMHTLMQVCVSVYLCFTLEYTQSTSRCWVGDKDGEPDLGNLPLSLRGNLAIYVISSP